MKRLFAVIVFFMLGAGSASAVGAATPKRWSSSVVGTKGKPFAFSGVTVKVTGISPGSWKPSTGEYPMDIALEVKSTMGGTLNFAIWCTDSLAVTGMYAGSSFDTAMVYEAGGSQSGVLMAGIRSRCKTPYLAVTRVPDLTNVKPMSPAWIAAVNAKRNQTISALLIPVS